MIWARDPAAPCRMRLWEGPVDIDTFFKSKMRDGIVQHTARCPLRPSCFTVQTPNIARIAATRPSRWSQASSAHKTLRTHHAVNPRVLVESQKHARTGTSTSRLASRITESIYCFTAPRGPASRRWASRPMRIIVSRASTRPPVDGLSARRRVSPTSTTSTPHPPPPHRPPHPH